MDIARSKTHIIWCSIDMWSQDQLWGISYLRQLWYLDWTMINTPRSLTDDHYFCYSFLLQRINDCVLNFDFIPKNVKIPWLSLTTGEYIPWLSCDWKAFSDFPRVFQVSLTWTNHGVVPFRFDIHWWQLTDSWFFTPLLQLQQYK